jgi:hypothetical protein
LGAFLENFLGILGDFNGKIIGDFLWIFLEISWDFPADFLGIFPQKIRFKCKVSNNSLNSLPILIILLLSKTKLNCYF